MNQYTVSEQTQIARDIFMGKEPSLSLDVIKQFGFDRIYSGLLRAGRRLMNSPEAADLLFYMVELFSPHESLSSWGESCIVHAFKKFPGLDAKFFEVAQKRWLQLPAPLIRRFGKIKRITPENFVYIIPSGKRAVLELAKYLGDEPTEAMFEHVCRVFMMVCCKTKNGINVEDQLQLFKLMPARCFSWVKQYIGWDKQTLVAIINSRCPNNDVKAQALDDVLPLLQKSWDGLKLTRKFTIPADIAGEKLLRILASLSLLRSGKQYIHGLPSKEDMAVRMLSVLLSDRKNNIDVVREANKIRDELARAIARVRKAKVAKKRWFLPPKVVKAA